VQIQERVVNEVGILRLVGRLTVNDQPGLLKQAIADLVQKGARHVILDLGGVRYIDSTRLGELIAAHVIEQRRKEDLARPSARGDDAVHCFPLALGLRGGVL
jgi:anti-anti-sigma factor